MDFSFKVCVRCFTYNHAVYIENALSGFTLQETSFPYICTIVDDASTDGEQEVINGYLKNHFEIDDNLLIRKEENEDYKMLLAQHKTNKNCFFAVFFLKYNHYQAKKNKMGYISEWCENVPYIAICEGDDYWIDTSKLQKQVNYMDANKDCTMSFHNAFWLTIGEKTNAAKLFNSYNNDKDLSISDVVNHWVIPTASMVVRKEYNINPVWLPTVYCGDFARMLNCINEGSIHYINTIASVYRFNILSSSSSYSSKHSSLDIMKAHYKLLCGFRQKSKAEFWDVLDHRISELNDSIEFHTILNERKFWRLIIKPDLVFRMLSEKLH